jgi:hypothetical protein
MLQVRMTPPTPVPQFVSLRHSTHVIVIMSQ